MGKKVTKYVWVHGEGHESVLLKPGDTVPSWATVENAAAFADDEPEEDVVDTGQSQYEDLTVDELKDEIRSRNEGRDAGDKISLSGKHDDLVAALDADDAQAE